MGKDRGWGGGRLQKDWMRKATWRSTAPVGVLSETSCLHPIPALPRRGEGLVFASSFRGLDFGIRRFDQIGEGLGRAAVVDDRGGEGRALGQIGGAVRHDEGGGGV